MTKETFERFVQYAYTGDYSIPKTEKRNIAVPPKVNGIHVKTPDSLAKPQKAENVAAAQPSSPSATNGIRGRLNSLGSDETFPVEPRDGSMSEKMDDEGTILGLPMPSKKSRKKKAKAAIEKAEKEAKEASLKAEKEPVQELETRSEPQPEETKPAETQPTEPELEATLLTGEERSPEQHILTADFQSLSYPLLASRDNYEGTCEPCTDFEKDHSYSNIFLSHASLYVLGDVQLVESLKALALFKLHKTLCVFELDKENIGDITDLARYAYFGEDNELDEGTGGLRGLVCQYMAIHAVELAADRSFMNLLAGGGQIVKDFLRLQLQRIH